MCNLIVDLKFLNHSQFHEHPQGGRYHGINVKGEVVEGELVDAQLTDQGDVGSLFRQSKREFGGGHSLPFLKDA